MHIIYNLTMDIKARIKEHGYTLAEVAAKLGVTQSALSQTVKGNPTFDKLQAIAGILGISVAELVADDDCSDFIAFIRLNGHTHTFTSIAELAKWVGGQH